MRTLHTLDYSEAKRTVDLIVEKALQIQKAASVAVADAHGDLICFAAWTVPRSLPSGSP